MGAVFGAVRFAQKAAFFHKEEMARHPGAGIGVMETEIVPALARQCPISWLKVSYEEAFAALGMKFHKTRPAKLFLRRMSESPEEALAGETEERFKSRFASIDEKAEISERREGQPFR